MHHLLSIALFFVFFLASLLPAGAQARGEPAGELAQQIKQAVKKKEGRDVLLPLCEKMLARDVISDFISSGETPMETTVAALQSIRELGRYVEQWKEELDENPGSDRLNFLLAIAALKYAPLPSRQGSPNCFLPVRVKIVRQGDEVCLKSPAFFEREDAETIRMSRKAMIGFFANGISGRFKEITLISNGVTVADPQWKQAQLGVDEEKREGFIKAAGDALEIRGAGWAPVNGIEETCFFAYYELDGDGSLEVVIDAIGAEGSNGMIGLMIRESLDPSAPQSSIVFAQRSNSIYFDRRTAQHETPGYLKALCASRPDDAEFLLACLRLMMRKDILTDRLGVEVAERLIKKDRGIAHRESYFFQDLYRNLGRPERFAELLSPEDSQDVSTEEALTLFYSWLETGSDLLKKGDAEGAVALWNRAEALPIQRPLPVQTHLERIIAYRFLKRHAEAKEDLRRLFLGKKEQVSAKLFLQEVHLSQPALAPVISLALHLTAREGIASDIAQALEKQRGPASGGASAEAIALSLRIAARDSAAIARLKNGSEIADLVRKLPPSGLYLILFQLQQFPEGRPIALKLLKAILADKGIALAADRETLLRWRLRLAEFQDEPGLIKEAARDLTTYAMQADVDAPTFSKVIELLLKGGDVETATTLARNGRQRRKSDSNLFHEDGEAMDLLRLHSGEGNPMPFVTAHTDGEKIAVRWWLGCNTYPGMLMPETRYFETPMPAFEQRYTLELYGRSGEVYGGEIPDENRLHTIPSATSRGEWSGPFLKDCHWIAATIRDASGNVVASPAVPVTAGTNLLAPLDPKSLHDKSGPWKATRDSFWAVALRDGVWNGGVFLSRLQPGVGLIEFSHDRIPIDPNRNYVFTGWMRTDLGQRDSGRYYADGRMAVIFWNAENQPVGEWYERPSIGNRWTLFAKRFGALHRAGVQAIPPGAVSAEIRVQVRTQCEVAEVGFYTAPEAR